MYFIEKINGKILPDDIREYNPDTKFIESINKYSFEYIPGEIVKKEIKIITQTKYMEIIRIEYFTKFYSVESIKEKYKIKKDNNKYFVKYILNISGTVNEYNCDKDLNNKKNLRRIEKKVKKKIDNYLNQTINKQYNSNSKFLGLENIIYLQNYKYNNEKIIVKTNINVLIKDIGQTNKSLKGAKKDEE
jgi:hypothetical protein